MALKPIKFTTENLPANIEVVLAEHDLPPTIKTGSAIRKSVTKYAGTYSTVQVNGLDYSPIELEGEINDSWWGLPGHAALLANNIEALSASGALVRYEYADKQLWGTFKADLEREDDWTYQYSITFEPQWAVNPNYIAYIDYAAPPAELPVTLSERADNLVADAEDAPAGLDTTWLADLLLELRAAQGAMSEPLQVLDDVASYTELTRDTVASVTRSMFNAVGALERAVTRTSNAGMDTIAQTAAARLLGFEFVYDIRSGSISLKADILAIIRQLVRSVQPVRAGTHVVRQGETLSSIASKYLGTHDRWLEIADANDLDFPVLTVGQVLDIPPREP